MGRRRIEMTSTGSPCEPQRVYDLRRDWPRQLGPAGAPSTDRKSWTVIKPSIAAFIWGAPQRLATP